MQHVVSLFLLPLSNIRKVCYNVAIANVLRDFWAMLQLIDNVMAIVQSFSIACVHRDCNTYCHNKHDRNSALRGSITDGRVLKITCRGLLPDWQVLWSIQDLMSWIQLQRLQGQLHWIHTNLMLESYYSQGTQGDSCSSFLAYPMSVRLSKSCPPAIYQRKLVLKKQISEVTLLKRPSNFCHASDRRCIICINPSNLPSNSSEGIPDVWHKGNSQVLDFRSKVQIAEPYSSFTIDCKNERFDVGIDQKTIFERAVVTLILSHHAFSPSQRTKRSRTNYNPYHRHVYTWATYWTPAAVELPW